MNPRLGRQIMTWLRAASYIVLAAALVSCSGGNIVAQPTFTPSPTMLPQPTTIAMNEPTASGNPDATARPAATLIASAEPDQIWLEQPFGQKDTLAVYFFTGTQGRKCLRFLVSVPGAQAVTACAERSDAALIVAHGVQQTSTGETFTIVAGRILVDRTRVVTFLMDGDEAFPAQVDGGGAILILPGQRQIQQAVPIDEFGNLTGDVLSFAP